MIYIQPSFEDKLQNNAATLELAEFIRHEMETSSEQETLTRFKMEKCWQNAFPTVLPKAVVLNSSKPYIDWVKKQGDDTN